MSVYDIFVVFVSIACFILISKEFSGGKLTLFLVIWALVVLKMSEVLNNRKMHNITMVIIFPSGVRILWMAANSINNLRYSVNVCLCWLHCVAHEC